MEINTRTNRIEIGNNNLIIPELFRFHVLLSNYFFLLKNIPCQDIIVNFAYVSNLIDQLSM